MWKFINAVNLSDIIISTTVPAKGYSKHGSIVLAKIVLVKYSQVTSRELMSMSHTNISAPCNKLNFQVDDSLLGPLPVMGKRWVTTNLEVNTFPGNIKQKY